MPTGINKITGIPNNTKHNDSRRRFYKIWVDMKQRCNNPNNTKHKYYKHISIDSKWNDYLGFKQDMLIPYLIAKRKYGNDVQLDRINNNGNYCKSNCRFVTPRMNKQNTSKNKWFIAINLKTGERFKSNTMRKFARDNGFCYHTIYKILKGIGGCKTAKKGKWTFKSI
jgi:hypothetical protein